MAGLSNAYDLDFDETSQEIYYIQHPVEGRILSTVLTTNAQIFRAKMNGENTTRLIPDAIGGDAYCLAFDWIGRNLYVGNKQSANIEIVRTTGNVPFRSVILKSDQSFAAVKFPVALAVHPPQGMLFWMDEGGSGGAKKIGRANMDGTNAKVLVSDISGNGFMALDPTGNRLYFSQTDAGTVSR